MNKKYWLRVGVAFAIINLVLCAIAFNLPGVRNPENNSDLVALLFPNILITSMAMSPLSPFIASWSTGIVYYVLGSFCWFLIGALLGWLYGKIKNKNKVI